MTSLITPNVSVHFRISLGMSTLSLEWIVRTAVRILTGKPTGKILLGRSRRRWEDNIKMELKEICFSTRNWVDSAQDRDYWRALAKALNLRVP